MGRRLVKPPEHIWLHICSCKGCRGRGAACMNAFTWLNRGADHILQHAKEDMLDHFDGLSPEIQKALNSAPVNVCSYCVENWVVEYGAEVTVELIEQARFVDDTRAVTHVDDWAKYLAWHRQGNACTEAPVTR